LLNVQVPLEDSGEIAPRLQRQHDAQTAEVEKQQRWVEEARRRLEEL
jgi:nitrogen fixation/metabolism regulation signal transduction histidine kinase